MHRRRSNERRGLELVVLELPPFPETGQRQMWVGSLDAFAELVGGW